MGREEREGGKERGRQKCEGRRTREKVNKMRRTVPVR